MSNQGAIRACNQRASQSASCGVVRQSDMVQQSTWVVEHRTHCGVAFGVVLPSLSALLSRLRLSRCSRQRLENSRSAGGLLLFAVISVDDSSEEDDEEAIPDFLKNTAHLGALEKKALRSPCDCLVTPFSARGAELTSPISCR